MEIKQQEEPVFIEMEGIRQNNLKNIKVKIPINSFTVICGPSGSGKTSLAFETLFAEGQRRYIESLSSYARQFLNQAPKPLLDKIQNIPPSIALEQKNTIKNSRSTVGTTSELIEYLRLLYSKLALAHCPKGHGSIKSDSPANVVDQLIEDWNQKRVYLCVPIKQNKKRFKGSVLIKTLIMDSCRRLLVIQKSSKNKNSLKISMEYSELNGKNPNKNPPEIKLKILEINPKTKSKDLPKKDFYLMVDRLVIDEKNRGRLVDSVSQSYGMSSKYNEDMGGQVVAITTEKEIKSFSEELSCSQCGETLPPPSPQLLSFNSPLGACPACNGFGNRLDIDPKKIVPNPRLSINKGAILPFSMPSGRSARQKLLKFCKTKKIDPDKAWEKLTSRQKKLLWDGDSSFPGVRGYFDDLETKKYKMHIRIFLTRFKTPFTCQECQGTRLKPLIKYFKIQDHSISDLCEMSLKELYNFLSSLKLTNFQKDLVKNIFEQLMARLGFLNKIGVHYLSLSRPTKSLSGGEFQRVLLAKQLGMGLCQTLYVLDEPTIGLHPKDNDQLIKQLRDLNQLGNTLVVVEHDQDIIKHSDYIIEMGPGSGNRGGQIVFNGDQKSFLQCKNSNTNLFLKETRSNIYSPKVVDLKNYKYCLEIKSCKGHNLKNISVKIPLHRIVTVTGVSGSGKSTLVTETLYPALLKEMGLVLIPGQPYKKLTGAEYLKNVLYINQNTVGHSVRSNIATYLKVFDLIRDLFSSTPKAQKKGYKGGTFSLNIDGGRCPDCKGLGYHLIDMVFMDDIKTVCDTCDGLFYQKEILEIKFKNRNIYEVLQMTVSQAMDFFVSHPNIRKPLSLLKQVGLDYLTLGQNTSSLSGGESQRIKIAKELHKPNSKATLYILDEPTTGLHFQEVRLLMSILHQIVSAGHSVLLIEHNLEVMAQSDYIIDLGPSAGTEGGKLIAQGSPLQLCQKKTPTGQYLKKYLN